MDEQKQLCHYYDRDVLCGHLQYQGFLFYCEFFF